MRKQELGLIGVEQPMPTGLSARTHQKCCWKGEISAPKFQPCLAQFREMFKMTIRFQAEE
jgi:hypothetical protein